MGLLHHTALRRIFLLAAAGYLFVSPTLDAQAGVIRDDRSDSLYIEKAANALYSSVGQFKSFGPAGNFLASGTIISNNWVLTAAHVVDGDPRLEFYIDGIPYTAVSSIAHSKWDGDISKGYDIALVEFGVDFTAMGYDPAALYEGSNEIGKVSTAVGYGTTGTGDTGVVCGDDCFPLVKRAGDNMIDAVLSTRGRSNRVLLTDFDNPSDPSDSSWGSAIPLDLEYLIAPGDSGGGLFIEEFGETFLAGVHSFGWGILDTDPNSNYGDAAGHTRVSSFTGWIDEIIYGGSTTDGGDNPKKGGGGGRGGKKTNNINTNNVSTFAVSTVPEPGAIALLAIGLVGLTACRKQRKAQI